MKKWWIGYTGAGESVMKVDVATETNVGTGWERSHFRLPSGVLEDAPSKDLFATEAEAKRARVLNEAEDLEGEARNRDSAAEHERDVAAGAIARAEAREAEARALRARAKFLRDGLAVGWIAPSGSEGLEMYPEVKDATEGRR